MMQSLHLKSLVAANVKTLRERRGLSQEQLAVAIDRTWQAVSHIETGKALPPLTTLAALAAALDVRPADLLSACEHTTDRRSDLLRRIEVLLEGFTDDEVETAVKLLEVLREGLRR